MYEEIDMTIESDVVAADEQFFIALMQADSGALDRLLADDFILVDVLSGSVIEKALLVSLVGSGRLVFEAIQPVPAELRVRPYRNTGVVTGRTQMSGRYEGSPWSARSRYTHVYVEQEGTWRLVSAQGTPVAAEE
jgi:ketosteroid isomerase-like protein